MKHGTILGAIVAGLTVFTSLEAMAPEVSDKTQPSQPTLAQQPVVFSAESSTQKTLSQDVPKQENITLTVQKQEEVQQLHAEVSAPAEKVAPLAHIEQPKVVAKPADALDTIDIEEGGNWLIKRQIFEDTFKLMDSMDDVNTKIRDMRMAFLKQRNDIDKDVALFMRDIGYNLGKLDQLVTTLAAKIKEERQKEGDLPESGRSTLLSIEGVEEKITGVQEAIQEILTLEQKIDTEILKSLEDRINESASYRQQGWKNLQSIKKILSDEKAQNMYNKTKALYETMRSILSWVQDKLQPYFGRTVQNVRENMATIKSHLATLQSQGVDIQKEVDALQDLEKEKRDEQLNEEIADLVDEATQNADEREEAGFVGFVKSVLWYPVSLISRFFAWLRSFF